MDDDLIDWILWNISVNYDHEQVYGLSRDIFSTPITVEITIRVRFSDI